MGEEPLNLALDLELTCTLEAQLRILAFPHKSETEGAPLRLIKEVTRGGDDV